MYIILGFVQVFISLGALAGGFMFIKDPSGAAMGFPTLMLKGSVFPDFLIPGLFLFIINGLGSLLGAILSFSKNQNSAPLAIALGLVLLAWIVIQIAVIHQINWMHYLYFSLGLVELALGILIKRQ